MSDVWGAQDQSTINGPTLQRSPFEREVQSLRPAPTPAAPPPVSPAPPQENPFAALLAPKPEAPAEKAPNPFAAIMNPDAAKAPTEAAPPAVNTEGGYGEKPWWWWGPKSGPREMLGIAPEDPNAKKYDAKDVPAEFVSNLGPSLAKHAVGLYDTVTNAVSSVVNHPGEVAATIRDELPDLPGHIVNFGAGMLSGMVNKYGSWEAFKKTAAEDPAGLLMDATLVLPAIGALGKLGSKVEKVGSVADPAAAMDTLRSAAAAGGKKAAAAADTLVGTANGIAEGALQKMFESGQKITPDVWKTMTGGMDWDKAHGVIQDAAESLVKQRSDNYVADMKKIAGADKPVDFTKVDAAVNDAGKIGYYKAPNDKSPGPGIRIQNDASVQKARGAILGMVQKFKMAGPEYHTALGFDALKKSIYDIAEGLEGPMGFATPASTFASKIAGAVKSTIMKEVPDYGKVMSEYGDATDKMKGFVREFKTGDSSKKLAAIKSMQQVWRNSAGVAHGVKTNMLEDVLKQTGHEDLMSQLAASSYHPVKPHGLRGVGLGIELPLAVAHAVASPVTGLPHLGGVLGAGVMMSPRVAGTAAYGAGRASQTPFAKVPQAGYDIAARGVKPGLRIQNQQPQPAEKRGGFFRGR